LTATDLGRYLIALVRDRSLKSPELTGDWEAKLREIERGRLDPRRFLDEIVRFTGGVVRAEETASLDINRWGDCPRCGRPVIAGKHDLGCSGWREGCPFVLRREYNGHALRDDQLRELLQHGVLGEPVRIDGPGDVLLQLAASGVVMEIPLPSPRPWTPAGKGGRRRERVSSGAPSPSRRTRAASPTRRKRKTDSEIDASPEAVVSDELAAVGPSAGFASVGLGKCPLCGREVIEQAKSYGCSGWKEGCRFAIWKTIAGKPITIRTAQALLRQGRTQRLKGFKSKAGKSFEARLRLEKDEVRFDFSP
jgi:DNA topoisomerase-3